MEVVTVVMVVVTGIGPVVLNWVGDDDISFLEVLSAPLESSVLDTVISGSVSKPE